MTIQFLRRRPRVHSSGCPCEGTGRIPASWAYDRERVCNCDTKWAFGELALHEGWCDTVPCPFPGEVRTQHGR